MFILQYKVSTTVIDLVVVFALFVFMLVLLCFCVATVFFGPIGLKIYMKVAWQFLSWSDHIMSLIGAWIKKKYVRVGQ